MEGFCRFFIVSYWCHNFQILVCIVMVEISMCMCRGLEVLGVIQPSRRIFTLKGLNML